MSENKRPLGQNMKGLIFRKMSVDAIPSGGGLQSGIDFLATPGRLASGFRAATEWCDAAIAAVRSACEPNPWKNSTEEEIAGELLRRIGKA